MSFCSFKPTPNLTWEEDVNLSMYVRVPHFLITGTCIYIGVFCEQSTIIRRTETNMANNKGNKRYRASKYTCDAGR